MKANLTIVTLAGVMLLAASLTKAEPPGPVIPKVMDRDTIKAIDRALNYLAKTQRNDGSWMSAGSYGSYPCAMTALGGMAFLGSGSTPESGRYSRNVRKAMMYLLHIAESSPDGLIAGPGGESYSNYGHGFAMMFLAQCYGMEGNPELEARLKKVLEKAALLTARCQSDNGPQYQNAGGWYYTPQMGGDEGSVTVTQLQALRACRNAGLKVPKRTIERAVAYLKHCQQPDGGICYSWQSRGSSRPAISAAGVACFFSAGVYEKSAGAEEAKMVSRLVEYCKKNVVNQDAQGHDFYTMLYMGQAMYQRAQDDASIKEWEDYYAKLRKNLLARQAPDGSWSDGPGTTYATAIGATLLQLPYGYTPIYQR